MISKIKKLIILILVFFYSSVLMVNYTLNEYDPYYKNKVKISIIGLGYVGIVVASVFSKKYVLNNIFQKKQKRIFQESVFQKNIFQNTISKKTKQRKNNPIVYWKNPFC